MLSESRWPANESKSMRVYSIHVDIFISNFFYYYLEALYYRDVPHGKFVRNILSFRHFQNVFRVF